MKQTRYLLILLVILSATGCITQFIPDTTEDPNLVVVEGLITDQHEVYTIKVSRSMALGSTAALRPLSGCTVTVTDDNNNAYQFWEKSSSGNYISDSSVFQGVIGRKYTLHINTNNSTSNRYSYKSLPVEMKPVPQIDSVYFEKVTIVPGTPTTGPREGCQIYLNASDRNSICKFYRWNFTETWEFRLPYYVENNDCWITNNSNSIHIKNTSVLSEDRVDRYPINFITYETDRLSVRYSILVNQYSLNEDEYSYWEKLESITGNVGSLYDITPASVAGNMYCIEAPAEQVPGYFSVSAKATKRIFINHGFRGLVDQYSNCATDTIYNHENIPGLDQYVWIIEDEPYARPPYQIITDKHGCADCTVRGSKIKPDFWDIEK
jgi:hypothetical protein